MCMQLLFGFSGMSSAYCVNEFMSGGVLWLAPSGTDIGDVLSRPADNLVCRVC